MKKNCDAVVGQLNHLIQTTNHHWEVIKEKKIEFDGEIDAELDREWTGDSFVFKLSRGNNERNHMDMGEEEKWDSLTTELGVDFWARMGQNRVYGGWESMDFGWGRSKFPIFGNPPSIGIDFEWTEEEQEWRERQFSTQQQIQAVIYDW